MSAKLENVPPLDGFVGLTEAGEILGVTRQHSYKRASNGGYKTLRRVGNKPMYVVEVKELNEIIQARSKDPEDG